MAMITRGLAGVIIGVGYGLLIGAITFLWWRVTHDPAHPGPMIPNDDEVGRLLTFFATLIAGGCGALVGVIVSVSGVNKARGGMIGLTVGAVVFSLFYASSLTGLTRQSWQAWQPFSSVSVIYLLFLPIGLGLTGVVVSIVTGKLKH